MIEIVISVAVAAALIGFLIVLSSSKTPVWKSAYFFVLDASAEKSDEWIALRLVKRYDVNPKNTDTLIAAAKANNQEAFETYFK